MKFILQIIFVFGTLTLIAQPSTVWKFKTEGKIYGSALAQNETIFVGSSDQYLYALQKKSGGLRWKFKTDGAIYSTPATDGKLIFFSSHDGNVYALDALSGKQAWKFSTKGERVYDLWDYYQSSPAIVGHTLIIGSGDGFIYAINKDNGKLRWEFQVQDVIHATPVVANDIAYVGAFDGNLYALDIASGNVKWKFKTKGEIYFPKGEIQREVKVYDGKVFFGSRDFNLYALDAQSGKLLWSLKEEGSWVIAAPVVHQNKLLFGTSDTHAFCAVDTTGKQVWRTPLRMRVYGQAALHQDEVIAGCFDGRLIAMDANTGAIRWTFQTDGSIAHYNTVYGADGDFKQGFELYGKDMHASENAILSLGSILASPLLVEDQLYFGATDGVVYALQLPD